MAVNARPSWNRLCTTVGWGISPGTLLYNQTMGDDSWTDWEVLDAASVGAGFAARGLKPTVVQSRVESG